MVRPLFFIGCLFFTLSATAASTASCTGSVRGSKLFFFARGSLSNPADGSGIVKINNHEVARFDGDEAHINYFTRTFSIRNMRGDTVSGRVLNLWSGASTLDKLELPGEGIRIVNTPVKCSVQ